MSENAVPIKRPPFMALWCEHRFRVEPLARDAGVPEDVIYTMRLYRFTFPAGTEYQQTARESCLLTLPDRTRIDVIHTPEGHANLYIHDVTDMNTVFMHQKKGGAL